MRGTASHDVVLDDVWVPASKVTGRRPYGEFGGPLTAAALHFALVVAATYLGIAAGARAHAIEGLGGAVRGPQARMAVPAVVRQVGLMDATLRTAWWSLL